MHYKKLATDLDVKFSLIEKQIIFFEKQILKKACNLTKTLNLDPRSQSKIYEKIIEVIEMNLVSLRT